MFKFLITAFFLSAAPAAAQQVGEVVQLVGNGSIDRAGQQLPLAQGAPIFADDIVTTAVNARVKMKFADNTELTLGSDGEVVIDEFVYADADTDSAIFRLAKGPVRMIAGAIERSHREGLKIDTPVATIGVRGTDVFAELRGQQLSAALFSGYAVEVTNSAGVTLLHPGEGTDAYGPQAPTPAVSWAPDRINRALGLVSFAGLGRRPLPYIKSVANADSLEEAVADGAFYGQFRLRYEHVDADNKIRSGHATTARLRAGYETAAINGFFVGAEFEATRDLGDRRNDGVNGRTTLPLIADPDSEVLNQAYIGWVGAAEDGTARNRLVVGRQNFFYENERWVGPVGFRQNDQTFDAAAFETQAIDGWHFRYAYVDRINRILGNNANGHWQSDSHLIGAATNLVPNGLLTAYSYILDLKPVPQFSSSTYGVRYDSSWPLRGGGNFLVEAEFAQQTDHAANPRDYSLSYWLVQPGVKFGRWTFWLGWERLGGNGLAAVQSPLATLHRHNGWADIFTTTPAGGLSDVRVRMLYEFPDAGVFRAPRLDLRVHDFSPAGAGPRYGREWDVDINANVYGLFVLGLRASHYDAIRFDADTDKLWLYAEVPF